MAMTGNSIYMAHIYGNDHAWNGRWLVIGIILKMGVIVLWISVELIHIFYNLLVKYEHIIILLKYKVG